MTSVENFAKEIIDGLQEYDDFAQSEMKKAVRKTATSVKKKISEKSPKLSGKYAKSWQSSKVKETADSLEMTIHSKDRYQLAHLLEFGHAKRGGGRVEGIPHIAPAEEKGAELLENLIEKALK